MRFMVIVKATKDSEAGKMPSEELLSAMAKFNEEMVKAGVMLDGNGLQPSSKGARVRFSGDKHTVIDDPFAETKEVASQHRERSHVYQHQHYDWGIVFLCGGFGYGSLPVARPAPPS